MKLLKTSTTICVFLLILFVPLLHAEIITSNKLSIKYIEDAFKANKLGLEAYGGGLYDQGEIT